MNKHFKTIFNAVAKPFIEKKLHELQSTNEYDEPRAHPGQPSSQLAKVGLGATVAMLPQVDSLETGLAALVSLLINLYFLYKREKKD